MIFDYRLKNYNFRIIIYIVLLSLLGVVILGSASGQDRSVVMKQLFGVGISLAACIIVSLIDYHKIFKFNFLIYGGCILLLAATLLLGKTAKGATRWLEIGKLAIQPSEFVKIGLIVILSCFLAKNRERINQPSVVGTAAILCLVPVAMVYKQPNLSTSIVITFTMLCLVYAAGLSYKWILGAAAVGIPVSVLSLFLAFQGKFPLIEQYQAKRILAKIFHSSSQYADLNRQQDNSIMAIGSGQLSGKGLFNNTLSSVKNGNFLSEETTDFIFAVIGEELGFFGSIIVLILYALLVSECLWIASRAKDESGRLICIGVASLLSFQTFANVAVATGLFPNTGLPLPFISSGISSLLSIFIGMGLVLNVGLQRKSSNH